MLHFKAIIAVIFVAGLMALPLYFYREYLNQGQSASRSAKILNTMEKRGVKDFSLPEIGRGNGALTLGQFKGKVVILNFWASWCAPCVQEFPSMISLVEKMNGELIVLAVSHDSNLEDLKAFLRAFEPLPEGFRILWDRDRLVGKEYGTDVLPESYIIGKQGQLIRKVVGVEVWDHPEAIEFFTDLTR